MTTQEAIREAKEWHDIYEDEISGCPRYKNGDEALAVLTALAEENAALKAEVKRLNDELGNVTQLSIGWAKRAEKAEAELAKWKPLIKAAGKFLAIQGDSPRAIVDRMGANNDLLDAVYAALPEEEK